MFSIANRWQANLSNCHAVNFQIQLLLFTHEHNSRNSCKAAYDKYCAAQRRPFTNPDFVKSTGQSSAAECQQPQRGKPKRKAAEAFCLDSVALDRSSPVLPGPSGSSVPVEQGLPALAESSHGNPAEEQKVASRSFLQCEHVIVNEESRTVHKVRARVPQATQVQCSWIPPYGARSVPSIALTGTDLFSCGTCFGKRLLLLLE